MKKLIIAMLLPLFLIGCGSVQQPNETEEIAIDIAASTIGYLVGKNNPDKINQWIEWGDKLLKIEAGLPVDSYEELLAIGVEISTDDEFLKMELEKLIRLLDFPDLQPPESLVLLERYVERVKLIVKGFLDGLYAARRAG